MKPPLQPWVTLSPMQSSRFCSLRGTSLPVFLNICPSRAPVALKAQLEAQWPLGIKKKLSFIHKSNNRYLWTIHTSEYFYKPVNCMLLHSLKKQRWHLFHSFLWVVKAGNITLPYLILHRSHIALLSPIHVFGDRKKQMILEYVPLLDPLPLKASHHFPKFCIGLQEKSTNDWGYL